ncbi:MAG: RtcB family protein [Euryhalocaulis sp.]|uniref:RtcB family protein n=1 Tax=Euryhalocaulis sp. TaxID=2744307 RepID=UPI0018133840|nr:RtcB family protein [Euryhalocaulis sp.]MBA4801282.1 RtcB family protein [Euryhalocaulis sp.]
MEYVQGDRAGIKMWTDGVQVENEAMQQLRNVATLPFIHNHLAVMPDVHWGMGATVGSVIPTRGAIVPAAVGVDIGCGMIAVRTTLDSNSLPDTLAPVRAAIEGAIPHGRTHHGDPSRDKGSWNDPPERQKGAWKRLEDRYQRILDKHPKAGHGATAQHLGTLGTGNHFIEICLDEADQVWVMLHSGSRGPGNKLGSYFIQRAKDEMERYFIGDYLADKDLSYFVEHTEMFDDYVEAVGWAQDYAASNREAMLQGVLDAMAETLPAFSVTEEAINCHHNYVERENHFGANVWVTRKGAVRARQGDLGIIPGSMGARSYIVEGKGNADSFCSCSHGAGRTMSRGKAKKTISLEDHLKATEGIECRKDADVIDESPAAYKNIDAVIAAQEPLVSVRHTLRQIVNVKG